MERSFNEGLRFENINFGQLTRDTGEYENCVFINCDFSDADLSDIFFSECEFSGCNLSMANLVQTSFKDVKFRESKLLGLHFNDCRPLLFAVEFEKCVLNYASFDKMKLRKTRFVNSSIIEGDFTEADLCESQFINCDLSGSVFNNTNLQKADLRTSFNYSIDPEINKIRKAKFTLPGIRGLLSKYDIEIED